MPTEREKMLAGAPYHAGAPELVRERERAQALCLQLNALAPTPATAARRRALLACLFGAETDACVTPPFFCDYGWNIRLGANVYFNFGCTILDGLPVTIGANTLFGPGVHVYTALHPLDAESRRRGVEFGKPVEIGADAWIGGRAVILPGVSLGAGSVIGAGSVVTADIPAGVLAVGNPCRVLRPV